MYYPYVQQKARPRRRVMTVEGAGSRTVVPDTVQIQLEVKTENEQLSSAQQENAYFMNQVINALLEFGVKTENIQTVSYNIFPLYDVIEGEQRFKGYTVTNAITVTSTSIERVGNMIDLAVQSGANQVSNIQFLVADERAEYDQALSLALTNAVTKARTMAETMQIQFDPTPVTIVENPREQPIAPRMFSAAEMNDATPIERGQMTIKAAVRVQFQY